MSDMRVRRHYRIAAFEEDLCLDFANTRYWRGRGAALETLGDTASLRDWCVRDGGVDAALVAATLRPDAGNTVLEAALAARECMYRAFAAVACGNEVASGDLRRLTALLAAAPARDGMEWRSTGLAWRIQAPACVEALLAPVIWSAADLLARAGMRRIRCCGNPQCLWLFLDRSKNGTRRWCDMAACGNRAKAARHYERTRRAAPGGHS